MSQDIWGENIYKYNAVDGDRQTNVLVIGAGIAGLTCAYRLLKLGKKVIVLEEERIGSGDTGLSTGFLTYLYDVSLQKLLENFDDEIVRQVYVDSKYAIDFIEQIIQEEKIDCNFQRVDTYYYSNSEKDDDFLVKEKDLAIKYGLDYQIISSFPFAKHRTTLCVKNQAKFNPLKYAIGLAEKIQQNGGLIYEKSYASDIKKDKEILDIKNQKDGVIVKTNNGNIKADKIVLTIGNPAVFYPEFEKKFDIQKTFVVKGTVNTTLNPGLYLDTKEPYNYFRIDESDGQKIVIFGGLDQELTNITYSDKRYEQLRVMVTDLLDDGFKISNSWSGVVFNSKSYLPYINEFKKNIYVMCGFGGNGLTFGTLGGFIISDLIVHGKTSFNWKKYGGETIVEKTIKENIFTIGIKKVLPWFDRVDIRKNFGKIIDQNGKKLAIYTDENGDITKLSPYCTHLGCQLIWNNKEKTWDCPCHESKFNKFGKVLNGPATEDLEKFD